jgi:hypothetical protein
MDRILSNLFVSSYILNFIVVMQAIFASADESMSPSDLTSFQNRYYLPVEAIADDVGGHVTDDACANNGEVSLGGNQ